MAVTTFLPVAKVRRRDDARPRNQGAVQAIAESMSEVGQITPILVRPAGDEFELIAGSHRLDAVVSLGWADILAIYAEHDDDLHAELAMIDENLCRSELSPIENATQLARRKVIYEELHPETRAGVAGAVAKHGATDKLSTAETQTKTVTSEEVEPRHGDATPSFAAATAAATGKTERDVRRATERGEKILPEVFAMLEGTKLGTGAYLDKLKNLPANEQYKAATRDLANLRRNEASGKTAGPKATRGSRAHAPAREEPPAHDRLIMALDMLDGITVAEVLAQCPPRERASISQRASSAIDFLGDVMAGASA